MPMETGERPDNGSLKKQNDNSSETGGAEEQPKNTIKSIDEIHEVLKEEGVKQPLVYLKRNIGGKERNVVLLGETHIATKGEERAANRILAYFKHIGCEGVNVDACIEGRVFFWIFAKFIVPFLTITFFWQKRSKKNTGFLAKAYEYRDQKLKNVLMLEKGWKPSIRTRFFFVVTPLIFLKSVSIIVIDSAEETAKGNPAGAVTHLVFVVIVLALIETLPIVKDIARFVFDLIFDYIFDLGPSRERIMMKNLVADLEKNGSMNDIIVLSGSSHTKPLSRLLKNKYGFVEYKSYLDY